MKTGAKNADRSIMYAPSPTEEAQRQVEDTLSYKFGRAVAQTFRPVAQGISSGLSTLEGASDLVTGYIKGEDRQTIAKNVNEALTRPRNFGIFGGSNVRPVNVEEDGTIKQDFGSFAKNVLLTGAQIGSLVAPTALASKGAPLLKTMAVGGLAEGVAGGIGEGARQIQAGERNLGGLALSTGVSATVGAALPFVGRAIGRMIPGSAARKAQALSLVQDVTTLNSRLESDASTRSLIWKLTDKTPDDLSKFTQRVSKQNDELTRLADEIIGEEDALKALKSFDHETNLKPMLDELKDAYALKAKPLQESLAKIAKANTPEKAAAFTQKALNSLDSAMSGLKKSTSEFKKLSAVRSLLAENSTYLLRNSADLKRLGFSDLIEYGDDVLATLESIPSASTAARHFKSALNTAKKATQAVADIKTKPVAMLSEAQQKLFAHSSSKIAKQVATKEAQVAAKRKLRDEMVRKLAELEATPEAAYVRELTKKFGSIDEVKRKFAFYKGVNKDVEPTLYLKEDMDKLKFTSVTGVKNLGGLGADTMRQWEAVAGDTATRNFIKENVLKPINDAVHNMARRIAAGEKQLATLAREAGASYDNLPLLGVRRWVGTGSLPDIAKKREVIFDALENDAISSLPPELQKIAQYTQDEYKSLFGQVNITRTRAGLPELKFRKNYVTHIQAMNMARQLGLTAEDITDDKLDSLIARAKSNVNKERVDTFFEKQRQGGIDYEKDPIEALRVYRQFAERDIEMNMLATRIRPFIKKIEEDVGGKTAEWFKRWMNEGVLGRASKIDQRVDAMSSTISLSQLAGKLSSNYSKATLAGNFGSALAQLSTLPLVMAKDGRILDTMIAFGHALSPRRLDAFIQTFAPDSKVLATRMLRQGEGLGDKMSDRVLSFAMEYADNLSAKTAWLSEYRGLRKIGLTHQAATDAADEATAKLMGMYDRIFVPQVLRSKTGKLVLPFHTFVFNQFNQIVRDGIIRGSELGTAQGIKYVGRMIGTMIVANAMWYRFTGQEPFPVTEDGNFQPQGILPVVGGLARYGVPGTIKGIGAAAALGLGLISRDAYLIEWGKKEGKGNMVRYLGIPGTSQIQKLIGGVGVIKDGGIESGDNFIPVEGTAEEIRSLLYGKWGSNAAKDNLRESDENKKEQFREAIFGKDE